MDQRRRGRPEQPVHTIQSQQGVPHAQVRLPILPDSPEPECSLHHHIVAGLGPTGVQSLPFLALKLASAHREQVIDML
ncbi:hypothetical protein D3C74_415440 [compost metagenome]